MATLYILAGPNGTGKTTFYEAAVAEGFIELQLPFINVDIITRNLPEGYTPENFAKADRNSQEANWRSCKFNERLYD